MQSASEDILVLTESMHSEENATSCYAMPQAALAKTDPKAAAISVGWQ